ncbi:ABC transporter permease [Bermanella sp. R86510]|uniref:ABC transporter permease n=1 Tax=unclassified Bermanella TaxID=2627862 RepID=UPI0037CB53CE
MKKSTLAFIIAATCISVGLFIPIIALFYEALFSGESGQTFMAIWNTVLLDYVRNSLSVVFLTLIFACLFAVAPAWWCARYEFKGRNYLQWIMVFPLAIPAYISAYIYTDLLDYAGPIQNQLRDWFSWQSPNDYWFFDIRSITGASLMLALALYPYIYLLMRHSFSQQSDHLEQAARMLGANDRSVFFKIRLPLARPALAIGCSLVAMESLADYGTVSLFAISTLTTAIYDSWLVYGSLSTAAKISCLLLIFVVSLLSLERWQRRQQKHFELRGSHQLKRIQCSSQKQWLIWVYCGVILLLGFVVPVIHLLDYSAMYFDENFNSDLWKHGKNTFLLAVTAAFICLFIALLFNHNIRTHNSRWTRLQLNLASLGYVIPGTVMAIAVLIPLGQLDVWANNAYAMVSDERLGLIFSGTGFALVLAFVMRFAAIANGSLHSAYSNISPNLDLAAKTLNHGTSGLFRHIHLPLLSPAIISAGLLVFIECVKELPAALLLRPFDFQTLSTYVFQFASDEQLHQGALAALLIIIVSLLPIVVLSRSQRMS